MSYIWCLETHSKTSHTETENNNMSKDFFHFTSSCCLHSVCLPAAYKVTVKSSAAEGDFMTYTATVVEVMKNTDKGEIAQSV